MSHTTQDLWTELYRRLPQPEAYFFEVRLIHSNRQAITKFYSLRQLLYIHTRKDGEWARQKNAEGYNVYFGINPRRRRRGTKADVAACVAFYVDIDVKDWLDDPAKYEEDINVILAKKPDVLADIQSASLSWKLPPSAVIDSGRGFQLYWFLKEPVLLPEADERGSTILMLENINAALEQYYHGDHIGNIDRIFRVPGFQNRKPVRKHQNEQGKWIAANKELTTLPTSVIFMDALRVYQLSDFPCLDQEEGRDIAKTTNPQEYSTPQTPQPTETSISPADQAIIEKAMTARNGRKFKQLWQGEISGYKSQSEAEYALVMLLAYWCDGDQKRIDRIFRQSGLYREKWNQSFNGTTNGWHTIAKVLEQRRKQAITQSDAHHNPTEEHPLVETLEDFLKLLSNVIPGKHDQEWKGKCPCHAQENTFLILAEINNTLRLTCTAGCRNNAILAALNLEGWNCKLNPPVKKGSGVYEIRKSKKDKDTGEQMEIYAPVSNYVFHVVNNFYDEATEVIQREIQFAGNPKTFLIPPESMLSVQKFREFCIGQGYYMFTGQANDLNKIWERELDDGPQRNIMEPDHVGYLHHEPGWWLFGNVCVKEGVPGKDCLLKPDAERNIFWIDGKGYKPRSLTGTDNSLPMLFSAWPEHELLNCREDLIAPFHACMDGYKGNLLLGWLPMVLMLKEITDKFHKFPLLYFAGRTQSGKTTTIRWLYSFFGIQDIDGASFGGSSPVGIMRDLAYWSNLPVWFDEYLNSDPRCKTRDPLLKNIYDRQGDKKGVKKSFGQDFYKIRGCMILSGEENPDVNSILTRCITIPLSFQKSKNQECAAETLTELSEYFPEVTVQMLQHKTPQTIEHFFQLQAQYEPKLKEYINDRRLAFNYSLVLAAYDVFIEADKDFQEWLFEYAKTDKVEKSQETPTNAFLSDFYTMAERGVIRNFDDFLLEGTLLYLPFDSFYDTWIEYLTRKHQHPEHKKTTLREYFKEEPYFMKAESLDPNDPKKLKVKRFAEKQRRAMCIDTTQCALLTDLPDLIAETRAF